MNTRNLQQIISNYIDKFEYTNGSIHQEYYKWQIARNFKPMMDDALKAPKDQFPGKLLEVKKLTKNLIDSYTQPFLGLVEFAKYEDATEIVRDMFVQLFDCDDKDMDTKMKGVSMFLERSHELRRKYASDSFRYNDDMHSVTTYMFLYDPDDNYIFKYTHGSKFADCIEFYEDWGYGDNTKLDVYYRMCDQLVEYIKSDEALLKTAASRYEKGWGPDPETLHPDTQKHILAFDIIYCCSTYNLFDGISFERPNTKEKALIQEKKRLAKQYSEELELARSDTEKLINAYDYLKSVYGVGKTVIHKQAGVGTVTDLTGTLGFADIKGTSVTVEFPDGSTKKLGIKTAALNGIISSDDEGYKERLGEYREIFNKEDRIRARLSIAEKKVAEYVDFLD